MYYVEYGAYPALSSNCPVYPSTVDNKYCLKPSSGNTLSYFPVNGSNPSFILIATKTVTTTNYSITDNSAPVSGSGNWIAGLTGTALANKWVYNADVSGTPQYKTTNTAVASPQGATGLDPNYPSNMVLVADNAVDFVTISYPARQACKAIGGRLPNMNELFAIYAGRATTYGNNFQADFYWSSTENNSTNAYSFTFRYGIAGYFNKSNVFYVRCVSG